MTQGLPNLPHTYPPVCKNFPDLGVREVLAALTRLPVAAREEGRRFRFTRRTLPRGPCSMEQQREKRKERRNEQLVAALADLDPFLALFL